MGSANKGGKKISFRRGPRCSCGNMNYSVASHFAEEGAKYASLLLECTKCGAHHLLSEPARPDDGPHPNPDVAKGEGDAT